MQLAQRHCSTCVTSFRRPLAAGVARVPASVPSSRTCSSRHLLCRAEAEQGPSQPAATEQKPEQPKQPETPAAAPSAPLLAKGQGTAIVTGAISILFGIAYLVLVQLLDMRGGELQPPPPEAYIP